MNITVPLAFVSWLPFTIFLFFSFKPHQAVLISVIGGVLFLPMAGYDPPALPPISKTSIIAFGLILGGRISGQRQKANFNWGWYDIPMLIWTFCPIATSLANNLGLYDGLSGSWDNILTWVVPYLAGRIYFDSIDKLHDLCFAIVIGGLFYLPLCLFEIRMSPQLSNIIYGIFPHSFIQHARYGGFRPIVFMQHGLMVALWMAATTTAAFWLWRSRDFKHIKGVPASILVVAMLITTVLCKSANGWFFLVTGCGGYFVYRVFHSSRPFLILLSIVPLYIALRVGGIISGADIESLVGNLFDAERVGSLAIRLRQEDLFIAKTLQQPLLGWGGYDRGWPVDLETGLKKIQMIDALWLITFSARGWIGLVSLFSGMLIGPWLVLRSLRKKNLTLNFITLGPVLLSALVSFFMIDSLVNGMINPVYIVISGALVSWYSVKALGDA